MTQGDVAHTTRVVDGVLRGRRSLRAYKPDPVPRSLLEEILDVASSAPSNSNTQPWQVHAVAGAHLAVLGAALVSACRENTLPPSPHFPDPLPDEYAQRQRDFGAIYYQTLGVDVADMLSRIRQTEKNFVFFGAPVGLIFTIDRRLAPHSWLDLGLFVQNVMIAAAARGLGTCPQVSFARFHPVIAQHLAFMEHELTVCGMSLGYPDRDVPVNQVATPRRAVHEFVSFQRFADP
ncbi:Nitroreductase [Variovorax sp. OK605]|jgi:nitroreductase|uniref:nitroreductase n=1 Tax=unclassified Variovorax TaxID=663243 RepID=UPI0008B8DD0F|nr:MULTISPECIES: nitroreductase [unclassified Variovorax]SEK17144.1 Nitroreductase [Variovorax sp. OK202]SFE73437.1 Nitroreductase [Variovorax sp. OK212]SFQ27720.1 Nitroreductase [Variovorax sp. OK605]